MGLSPDGECRDERRVRQIREAVKRGLGKLCGFVGETPSHGRGIIDHKDGQPLS